ncbi:MAG: hypothetical protein ACRC8S_10720 [Fimbriiglobus sp.]
MMRQFIPLILMAAALVPDWATALQLGGTRYYPPVMTGYECMPQVQILPPCLPPVQLLPECIPGPSASPPETAPINPPRVMPETTPPQAKPEPAKPEVPKTPIQGVPRISNDTPNIERAENRIPATPVPTTPAIKVPEVKPSNGFATPEVAVPKVFAPPEKVPLVPDPKIPPLVPRVPGGDPTLPPLAIPSEPRTSQSQPLAKKSVEIIPVNGDKPTGDLRQINIFNLSDRDIKLKVLKETITLPKGSVISASVPVKFTWSRDDQPTETVEVPANAPGVEIVIRK